MIEINHLVKKYGNHYAVNDLTFRVEKGQIYGFLGPNGAGKSTTMNIITGYLAPSGGEVLVNGFDIMKEPEQAKKCIGYLPEQPPLYQDMTVEEYLEFAAELKKIPRKERKKEMEEAMKASGILDVRKRLIRNLSKGYKQRVGLAQALMGNPQVIILDEPTVGLDPKQMIEMRDLIRSLKEKHTVILSSHILSEVSAVCDQIMIISRGKLVACDTPEGLSQRMRGGAELEVTVRANENKLKDILNNMPQVESYTAKSSSEEETEVHILSAEGKDIREELFYTLAEKRCPIIEMRMVNKSLEDIFLELTEKQGKIYAREKKSSRFRKKKENWKSNGSAYSNIDELVSQAEKEAEHASGAPEDESVSVKENEDSVILTDDTAQTAEQDFTGSEAEDNSAMAKKEEN